MQLSFQLSATHHTHHASTIAADHVHNLNTQHRTSPHNPHAMCDIIHPLHKHPATACSCAHAQLLAIASECMTAAFQVMMHWPTVGQCIMAMHRPLFSLVMLQVWFRMHTSPLLWPQRCVVSFEVQSYHTAHTTPPRAHMHSLTTRRHAHILALACSWSATERRLRHSEARARLRMQDIAAFGRISQPV